MSLRKQQSVDGGGIRTPCEAISTRGVIVSVSSLLGLQVHGRISDPSMGPCPCRVRQDLGDGPRGNSRWRWLHEPQRISDQRMGVGLQHGAGRYRRGEILIFVPVVWSYKCMGGFLSGDRPFPPRVRRSLRWPRGKLLQRVGSMIPSHSATSGRGRGPHRAGRYRPGR